MFTRDLPGRHSRDYLFHVPATQFGHMSGDPGQVLFERVASATERERSGLCRVIVTNRGRVREQYHDVDGVERGQVQADLWSA